MRTISTNDAPRGTFANTLRSRDEVIAIGTASGDAVRRIRVEAPEVWDVVRFDAAADTPVRALKLQALDALLPDVLFPDEFMVKFGGAQVLDESVSIDTLGVRDGSVLVVTRRRRRPVR